MNIDKSIPTHSSNYKSASGRQIKYIVIHYTGGNGTAKANAEYYSGANRSASAHFFVGHASESAKIYQGVDPDNIAWHCGTKGTYYHAECRNSNSIGIETCCHNDTPNKTAESKDWYFDDETIDALVELTRTLMDQCGINVDHVVRHYDVTHKTCPAPWVHDNSAWEAFKVRLTEDSNKAFLKTKLSLSSETWAYLDDYKYSKDLYRKWAESYK